MKERLAVISTKNPKKEILLSCIENLKLFYEEFDIVIIDSDSDSENLNYCEYVPLDCKVELCKNKNFELGAWTFAFNKYNQYKVYMFIQDTITPIIRIPSLDKNLYENGTIYTWDYIAKISDGGYLENLKNVYKDTFLNFISLLNKDHIIRGSAHSFFILNKEDINIILQLENAYIKNYNNLPIYL